MRHVIDLMGLRFGRLTVIDRGHDGKTIRWICLCDCGGMAFTWGYSLRSGMTQSCGCRQVERAQQLRRTHGLTAGGKRPREYGIWAGMIQRCTNPRVKKFEHYGGRGIAVCARWRDSYEAFIADVGPSPTAQHQLDRIDPDGDYEPGNCRWVTRLENARNKRPKVFAPVPTDSMWVAGLLMAA